jgi:5-methyltetrahydrofolate--homocysteine methyltransferase
MVGGATTSKLHTAVKIAPKYDGPVIHARDASQNPLIAAKLLNPSTKGEYIEHLNAEYDALRDSVNVKKEDLVSLSEARAHGVKTDWSSYKVVKPNQMGVHIINDIPLEEVIPYIHWTFFFAAWRLVGKYDSVAQIHDCDSCRNAWLADFPADEREKAAEAMKLYFDAKGMLNKLVDKKTKLCKAVYGFFPASSENDIINIGDIKLPVLRQQSKKANGGNEKVFKSLADYVKPISEEGEDYIGAFVVTGGFGAKELSEKLENDGDSYSAMLLQTLTDRLAEATTEYLHRKVRTELWGYAPDENLEMEDLFKVKYKGIRPAIGYPSLPDQLLNQKIDELLGMNKIGVKLTENGAMTPTASVSGLFIANPNSEYFMIGKIDEEQTREYAQRRNLSENEIKKILSRNI